MKIFWYLHQDENYLKIAQIRNYLQNKKSPRPDLEKEKGKVELIKLNDVERHCVNMSNSKYCFRRITRLFLPYPQILI